MIVVHGGGVRLSPVVGEWMWLIRLTIKQPTHNAPKAHAKWRQPGLWMMDSSLSDVASSLLVSFLILLSWGQL